MSNSVFILLNDNMLGDWLELINARIFMSKAKLLLDENVELFGMSKKVRLVVGGASSGI